MEPCDRSAPAFDPPVEVRVDHPVPPRGQRATAALVVCLAACMIAALASTADAKPTSVPTTPAASTTAIASGPTHKAWAGGPAYYAKFSKAAARGWTSPSFFPIGVWYESVVAAGDTALDLDVGLNTYVGLTNTSNFSLVDQAGMSMITTQSAAASHPSLVGWFGDDEVDMRYGPGAGFSHLQGLEDTLRARRDGRFLMNNYGKGVLFWQTDTDAARFVNSYQDVVSADLYWHTDPNGRTRWEGGEFFSVHRDLTQAEAEQSANYGATVDDVHRLMQKPGGNLLMPQWAFIEVGQPWTENVPTIAPTEVKGAVWSSLIHGAAGIIYFNHSFGGPCQSQHVLRDPCYTAVRNVVKKVNREVTSLAPVLNTQSLQVTLGSGMDTMVKRYGGQTYVFAMLARNATAGTRTLTLPTGLCGSVTVLFESRTLPNGCTITDSFTSRNAVHVYRVGWWRPPLAR